MKGALLGALLLLTVSAITIAENPQISKVGASYIINVTPLDPSKFYQSPMVGAISPSFYVSKFVQYDLSKVMVGAKVEFNSKRILRMSFIYRSFKLINDGINSQSPDNWFVEYTESPVVGAKNQKIRGMNVTWITQDLNDKVVSFDIGSDQTGIRSIKVNWKDQPAPYPVGDTTYLHNFKINCANPYQNVFAHQSLFADTDLKALGLICDEPQLDVTTTQ